MRSLCKIPALLVLLFLAGCGSGPAPFSHRYASGHYSPEIIQCVPYARDSSGVRLYGNADSWWSSSASRYLRGPRPQKGAVLVLKKTPRMKSGHVAVVKNLITSRSINVTHSNWGSNSKSRHIIYESMRADDISPRNDWTQVRFWNDEKNVLGQPYAAYGFIYP